MDVPRTNSTGGAPWTKSTPGRGAVAASYENKAIFLQCPVPQIWLQPETTRKIRCSDVWLFPARVPLSRLLGVRPDSLRTHHLLLSSLTCVCQFPFHMEELSSKARVLLPHRYGARRSCFPGRVAVRSTRGRGEVVGDQVALRALGGSWSAARARQKGAGDPLSIPVYVPIHSSHVRSKVQTNQMLCEQQHFCLKPGVVPLSSGPQIGLGQYAMRDSARDCQAHVETRTFRRTLISLPSLSPFLHSPIETLFRPCPRIHTLLTRPTPFVLCSSRLCHSARIFAP